MLPPVAGKVRFGLLGTCPPTLSGPARFSDHLSAEMCAQGAEVSVVRVADDSGSVGRVVGELFNGSASSVAECTASLNRCDVALIQHDDGMYGGTHGDQLLDVLEGLRVPSMVTVHTVPKNPAPHQRWVLERIAATTDRIVVMSEAAREVLCSGYAVERRRVITIPRGATVPLEPRGKRPSRPIILTWGLLRPGKGIERVIEAMRFVHDAPGHPRYLVAGRTDPKEHAAEGETYRNGLIELARREGVADSVTFDGRYYGDAMLTELIQSAAVIVLPYDSTDHLASGVLADAVVGGRPVVATGFPHAVEMLCTGAGILVGHDDQAALVSALRRVLTDPRLAGAMAAEARRLAPGMQWSVVAGAYQRLGRRLLSERRARV
ncbi:glycosyltransferase [Mycolicibacterium xanthum]|uniref:glycosyltransferase n=1 Tax=Mycolicibacterium xanthum TaxID=2796469 RepID=UPI0027DF6FF8|nr:glycosyltransferase [Mycolicibacterium xanthum]